MNNINAISHKLAISLLSKLQRDMELASGRGISVYITSAVRGEGKTFVAETLVRYIAALSGYQILLVDANLEDPKLHKYFHVDRENGLSNGIRGGNWEQIQFKKTEIENLTILTAGSDRHAGLVFPQQQVKQFLDFVTKRFDLVFFDGASLSTTGANSLVYLSNGILLVLDSQSTKREVLYDALSDLLSDADKIIGVVLNKKLHYIPRIIYRYL